MLASLNWIQVLARQEGSQASRQADKQPARQAVSTPLASQITLHTLPARWWTCPCKPVCTCMPPQYTAWPLHPRMQSLKSPSPQPPPEKVDPCCMPGVGSSVAWYLLGTSMNEHMGHRRMRAQIGGIGAWGHRRMGALGHRGKGSHKQIGIQAYRHTGVHEYRHTGIQAYAHKRILAYLYTYSYPCACGVHLHPRLLSHLRLRLRPHLYRHLQPIQECLTFPIESLDRYEISRWLLEVRAPV